MNRPYSLTLTEDDVRTIAWVGDRYSWSHALMGLEAGTHRFAEHEAWSLSEKLTADCDGDMFPLLGARSELAAKLFDFCDSIV